MRPCSVLSREEASGLRGIVFDLDDTLLDHGRLTEAAYSALHRLDEGGLLLVACTGRPAGWGEVIQRQWPIDATVAENGAIGIVREPGSESEGRLLVMGRGDGRERAERRSRLAALARELVEAFPDAAIADDDAARRMDVALDTGEHSRVAAGDVAAMRALARSRGVRTVVSSVHLHLTFEGDDKASGTLRLLGEVFGEDPCTARRRFAFVGDSANDAAPFAAFATTFGVANVRAHLRALTVGPRFVASQPMGAGFAEIARTLLDRR